MRRAYTWRLSTVVTVGLAAIWGCGSESFSPPKTPTASPTTTHTAVPATPTATNTAVPTASNSALPTQTLPPTATNTPLPTQTLPPTATATPQPTAAVFVYWDQNEEEDAMLPSGQLVQLVPPWDPNGQMCIFPDSSGRPGQFVTGYNPTLPGQHNLGGPPNNPLKNPPVGLAIWDRRGGFTGQVAFVPGQYALPGSDIGGDIPPDNASTFCTDGTLGHCQSDADCTNGGKCSGTFNDNGSFTGCAFDSKGDLFGADIGQAQGSSSSPDQGRIIEWFPPDYTSYCIIFGPTQGGDGAHHVNGTGGLRNPGMMAVDPQDNLYVPESGAMRVLRFDHSVLPSGPQDCGPDGLLTPPAAKTVFIQRAQNAPAGIALDPTCSTETTNCWAVTNILSNLPPPIGGGNAVNWFTASVGAAGMAQPTNMKGPIPKGTYSPFGVAVSPSGDVFFIDIGLICGESGCDTINDGGGIFKVTFTNGQPSTPVKINSGLNFPTSVTVCDSSTRVCPIPATEATPVTQPTPSGQG